MEILNQNEDHNIRNEHEPQVPSVEYFDAVNIRLQEADKVTDTIWKYDPINNREPPYINSRQGRCSKFPLSCFKATPSEVISRTRTNLKLPTKIIHLRFLQKANSVYYYGHWIGLHLGITRDLLLSLIGVEKIRVMEHNAWVVKNGDVEHRITLRFFQQLGTSELAAIGNTFKNGRYAERKIILGSNEEPPIEPIDAPGYVLNNPELTLSYTSFAQLSEWLIRQHKRSARDPCPLDELNRKSEPNVQIRLDDEDIWSTRADEMVEMQLAEEKLQYEQMVEERLRASNDRRQQLEDVKEARLELSNELKIAKSAIGVKNREIESWQKKSIRLNRALEENISLNRELSERQKIIIEKDNEINRLRNDLANAQKYYDEEEMIVRQICPKCLRENKSRKNKNVHNSHNMHKDRKSHDVSEKPEQSLENKRTEDKKGRKQTAKKSVKEDYRLKQEYIEGDRIISKQKYNQTKKSSEEESISEESYEESESSKKRTSKNKTIKNNRKKRNSPTMSFTQDKSLFQPDHTSEYALSKRNSYLDNSSLIPPLSDTMKFRNSSREHSRKHSPKTVLVKRTKK